MQPPADTSPRVLVILPAWNEARAVADVVRRVRAGLPDVAVLVVDDGSLDATAAAALAAGARVIRLPYNLGIGGAVQCGFLYALEHRFDVVVRLDSDGQHPPEAIPDLLAALREQNADLVVGSRFLGEDGYRPALARRLGIRLFARLLSCICGQRLTDTTSGFRAANALAVAHMARMHACDYPEIESLITLHKAGYRIAETPVRMQQRTAGNSSISTARAVYYTVKVLLAVLVDVLAAPHCTRDEMARLATPPAAADSED